MLGGRALSRYGIAGKTGGFRPGNAFVSTRSLSHIATRPNLAVGRGAGTRLQANSSWTPAAVSGFSFARFKSTSSTTTTTTDIPASSQEATQIPGSDSNALEDVLPISEIPERLGYLKELGLDYGWGPSAFMEWTIEHIHVLTGVPWWASIVASSILIRLALFRPAIVASNNAAKSLPVKDKTKLLRTQRTLYLSQGKQLEAAKAKAELDELHKSLGISVWKSFVPMLQIPLGFGIFRVVRGMSTLPVPGLAAEEVAWIHDLTTYDPLFVLPVLTSVFTYMSLKRGSESGITELQNTSIGKSVLIGLPALSLMFMSFQPASLQMYFAASGLFAMFQSYLLNTPATRAMLKMEPIPPPTSKISTEETNLKLRMIENETREALAQLQKKRAEMKAQATKEDNLSMIDKMVANAKQGFSNVKTEMNEKLEEMSGNVTEKTADGTHAIKPRLTDAQRQQAQAYRVQREEEERYNQSLLQKKGPRKPASKRAATKSKTK